MMTVIHAASATLALILGALLLALNKRLPFHTRFGATYHWTMLVVALSALAISLLRGRAVMFTYLAPPSYALALIGYMAGTRRWSGWLRWHIAGQTASYVALLTGLGIQMAPRLIPHDFIVAHRQLVLWSLLLGPALLASPFIARTRARWIRKSVASGFGRTSGPLPAVAEGMAGPPKPWRRRKGGHHIGFVTASRISA